VASLIPAGTTVTVETKYFPPLTVALAGEQGRAPGLAGFVTAALKPKVTLRLAGQTLASVAPAGEPAPNRWGTTRVVLAVVVGLAVFTLFRVLK
jgi:hypothetical protein